MTSGTFSSRFAALALPLPTCCLGYMARGRGSMAEQANGWKSVTETTTQPGRPLNFRGGQDCGRAAQKRNARWFCDIRLDVASLNRLQDGAGAVSHPQFSQNVGHVILDCTLREQQCGRDFAIAVPPCHQS